MSDFDEVIKTAATEYARLSAEVNLAQNAVGEAEQALDKTRRERDAVAKTLMQHVGRNIDERHIRVGEEVVHVRFDPSRGPSVRLVKLS